MDKMKMYDGLAALIEIMLAKMNKEKNIFTSERVTALYDFLEEIDDMRAQIKLEQLEEEGED